MNKIARVLLFPLLVVPFLAGCNAGGGDSSGDPTSSDTSGDKLPGSADQAKNKLRELGESEGYEIAFKVTEDDDETSSNVFGMKNNIIWWFTEDDEHAEGYKINSDNSVSSFSYDEDEGEYVVTPLPGVTKDMVDDLTESFTMFFYFAYSYQDGYTKVGDVTYVGRSAVKYNFSYIAVGAAANVEVVIDKATGITLCWKGQAAGGGEYASASFEVTSFKTGSQVTTPIA